MGDKRQMTLITKVYPLGGHLAGWRHPTAYPEIVMNLDVMIDIAKTAERGKFHGLFLADGNAVREMDKPELFEAVGPSDRPAVFEPVSAMAAIAQHTKHVGMFATASTTYEEPYLLARKFASLDHISHGRAIWNVVTGSFAGDAANFGTAEHPDRYTRYERATECLEVCKGLWDSWAEDAFLQDKTTGRFLDSSRVHMLNHHGKYFDVQGPLNVARCPNGYPVLFMAGQSEPGREFAAKHADALFLTAETKEQAVELYADIKSRLAKYGREPDDLKIVPRMLGNVAKTRQEAQDLYGELNRLISPSLGVEYLSMYVAHDMSQYPIDGPMPELTGDVLGIRSHRDTIVDRAIKEGLTIRQTYERLIAAEDDPPFTGTPEEVADDMQDWFESYACDGFNVQVPTMPLALDRFVDLAIPELQRRGLFHEDYIGGTLREEMGLKIPPNQFFDAPATADMAS